MTMSTSHIDPRVRIGHVHLVADLKRALKFYSGVHGSPRESDWPRSADGGLAMFTHAPVWMRSWQRSFTLTLSKCPNRNAGSNAARTI